ncbi:hypothetical protein [Caulobacter segnis]
MKHLVLEPNEHRRLSAGSSVDAPQALKDLTASLAGELYATRWGSFTRRCLKARPVEGLDIDLVATPTHSMIMTDFFLRQVREDWVGGEDWGRFLAAKDLLDGPCAQTDLSSSAFWAQIKSILKPAKPVEQPWIFDGQRRLRAKRAELYISRKQREVILEILRDRFAVSLLTGAQALEHFTQTLGDLLVGTVRQRVTTIIAKAPRHRSTVRDRILKFDVKTGVSPPLDPPRIHPTAERSHPLSESVRHEPDHRYAPRGNPRRAHYSRPTRRSLPEGLSAASSPPGRPHLGGHRHVRSRSVLAGWRLRHPGPGQVGDDVRLGGGHRGHRDFPVAYLTRPHAA